MFGNSKKHHVSKVDTLVGQNTEIRGDVIFSGGLHVDGRIKGNVLVTDGSESTLTLSEHGKVEGEVRVPHIILNGEVQGDVYASEHIELAAHARIQGNVYYNLLEMAMGAEVNGSLVHQVEHAAAKPKPATGGPDATTKLQTAD